MSNAMKELYSKHKDRDPQGTVDGIVEMLEQAGLDTEVRWTSHPFEGLCSNRVTIAGTNHRAHRGGRALRGAGA